MIPPNCDCGGECHRTGEERKAALLALLAERREIIVNRGRRALLARLLAAGTATADDVRAAVPLPVGIDPRCLGAVPGALADAGIIRRAGYVKTARPERHDSVIALWELADAQAARQWLIDNPDRLDPVPKMEREQTMLFDITPQKQQRPAAATGGR